MADMEETQHFPEGLEEETEPPHEDSAEDASGGGVIIQTDRERPREAPEEVDPSIELVTFAFIELFRHIGDQLMQQEGLHSVDIDATEPTPEITIQTIEDGLGGFLADELKSLYRLADTLTMHWRGEELSGDINIVSFTRVFGRWLDSLWRETAEMSEEEADFVWSLRGFDVPRDTDALWGVLSVDPEDPAAFSMHVRHPDGEVLPLDLGFIDYLYCAVEARGAHGWQLLFVADEAYDLHEDPWGYGVGPAWLDALAARFPDLDRDFFEEQFYGEAPE